MQFEKKTRDKSVDKLKKALTINLLSTPFFVGGPTCTITNLLTYSLSISYKIIYYPKGNKIVTFWVINYPVG